MANLTVFCCYNSLYGPEGGRNGGKAVIKGAHKIEVACGGRIEAIHILKAIENGADGVLVVVCPESECKLIEGSRRAGKRVEAARRLLGEAGVEPERVMLARPEPPSAQKLEALVKEAEAAFDKLGHLQIKKPLTEATK